MHIADHVAKVMKVRESVIKAMGYEPELNTWPSETEKIFALYTQAAMISLQSELVSDEIGRLDRET